MGRSGRALRLGHGGRAVNRPSRAAAHYLTVVLIVWATLLWIIVP